jgi:class 3 adenylate cyclase
MIIGKIQIPTVDSLPHARDKLRVALMIYGISGVKAAQIVGVASQKLRYNLPQEIQVVFNSASGELTLLPEAVFSKNAYVQSAHPFTDEIGNRMRDALSRPTREELLHNLERQVQERTSELNSEREKSERLLKNMLPSSIAERLKDGQTIADEHLSSVLFVDIVGFTKWAAQLNAAHLVEYLDLIFGEFDAISRRHGLEKIKTIGDCYMAASGLPIAQEDHADRAVQAGLHIIEAMATISQQLKATLNVRVGVHCGPLIAGVIGVMKPFYDIWGDTVNIASRMESNGEPGRVHVSDDVRQCLTGQYALQERGFIDIKNRGSIRTWFIDLPR